MRIGRRRFLRGATATVALPWLEALAPRGVSIPVRAVWLYFPNGASEGSWTPAQVGARGELLRLNAAQAPLERHRARLLLPRRLWTPEGNDHGAGTATWLTGGDWDELALDAGGPSVDHVAGAALPDDGITPALSVSARGEGSNAADLARNSLSWSASDRPVFRESDPRAIFRLLFGGDVQADRSLLDGLRLQVAALSGRVSRTDRERLEVFLDALRGLERRIAFVQSETTARRLGLAHEYGLGIDAARSSEAVPEDHGAYLDLLLDLVALALWSGASRVATVMLDHGQSNRYCNFIPGVRGTWHALSHWKDASGLTQDDDRFTRWGSVETKREMYDRVVTWHHARVARFLDRLAELPELDGSLLDHALVVYGSSIADGHEHGKHDLPLLLAGSAGGAVRPGRVLDPRRPANLARLHLATLRALGVPAERFAGAEDPLDLA